MPSAMLALGQLRRGGGLADAVHADEQPHRRSVGGAVQRAVGAGGLEPLGDLVAQEVGQRVGVGPGGRGARP